MGAEKEPLVRKEPTEGGAGNQVTRKIKMEASDLPGDEVGRGRWVWHW